MEYFLFSNTEEFHDWLTQNHDHHSGVWIRFDKINRESCISPEKALDEALCFGWIDGQIKSIDAHYYLKYFAKRTPNSIWSTKNKASIERLIEAGRMTPAGYSAVEKAKKEGRWDKADLNPVDYSMEDFMQLLIHHEKAYNNFLGMSQSIQKTYSMSYYALKKLDSRQRRLIVIIDRLENNLKPM